MASARSAAPVLVLVGRRQGALRAARALRRPVVVVDDTPAPPKSRAVHAHVCVDLSDEEACVDATIEALAGAEVAAAIPLVERAVLPAAHIRERLGLRGMGVAASRPWRDKIEMKERVAAAGVPTAPQRAVDSATDPGALIEALGLPMVIKPRAASGGRGAQVCRDAAQVASALRDAPPGLLTAEGFVVGRELSVESFVIDVEPRLVNVTDYVVPTWSNVVPAELDEAVDEALRALNRAALSALGIDRGMTHLEAFIQTSPELKIVFGEAASRPPGGFIMDLIAHAYGFAPWQAVLEIAMGLEPALPEAASASAGVWFLHGGEGSIEAVEGIDEARAVPGVLDVATTLQPGQRVRPREGVGEHHGRIVVTTRSHADSVAALEEAHEKIRILAQR